jgi:hypothetical protein
MARACTRKRFIRGIQAITINSAVIDEFDMAANEAFHWDRPGDPPRSKSVLTIATRPNAAMTRW